MSHITCHVSGVTFHVLFFFYKVVNLVGGGSVLNRHLHFKQALPKLCHSSKIEDGVEKKFHILIFPDNFL